MKKRRWRSILFYFLLVIGIFGVSGYALLQNKEKLITGTEIIGYGVAEKAEKAETAEKAEKDQTEIDLQAEAKRDSGSILTMAKLEATVSAKANIELIESKEVKSKSSKDFPSPVQAEPIRKPGNYYSEALQAYLFHAGTDYAQAEGAVIRVKHPGKVIYAGADAILGQKVEIDGGEGWSVIYGGLENLRVKEGNQVEVNQAIGQVGYYPYADGVKEQPQLHYEIRQGDEVVIPDSL